MLDGIKNHKALNGGAPQGWRILRPQSIAYDPVPVDTRKPVVINAVVSTWQDQDIIGACIKNCFDNGCKKVLLLDNGSRDGTVETAKSFGATIGKVYRTEKYDDDLRTHLQNSLVKESVEALKEGEEEWWLTLDADEFPCGPHGKPLVEFLPELPSGVRIIGFNSIDLYPSKDHEHATGSHPAECMTHAMKRCGGRQRYGISCDHWKHPLIRYRGGLRPFNVAQSRGSHCPSLPEQWSMLYEPLMTLWMFHAPYRGRKETEARLKLLCNGRNDWDDHVTGGQGAVKRWRSLQAVYDGRWDAVEVPHTQMYGRPVVGITPYSWKVLVPDLAGMFGEKDMRSNKVSLPIINQETP